MISRSQLFKTQLLGLLGLALAASACVGNTTEPFVDPASGPVYGGTRITVFGSDFKAGMRVRIGEAECINVELVSEEEIRCTTGASEAGIFDVNVLKTDSYEPHITITDGFEYTGTVTAQGAVVWANDGGDKVVKENNRASIDAAGVVNSVWDGTKISVFGAKNEVVNFNLIVEAAERALVNVTVELNSLTGPGGTVLQYTPGDEDSIFDYTNRQIELFFVRYLKIKGLSLTGYLARGDNSGDERHIPHRLRRDYTLEGFGEGVWTDRPDHDKSYPDIAVPLELENGFPVAAGQNQSIWADVYVPKTAPAGLYTGTVTVREDGVVVKEIPVELTVRNFTLPDVPTAKTMISMGYGDVNERYVGIRDPHSSDPNGPMIDTVRNRHFQMAHRHKLSLVDENTGRQVWNTDAPRPEWLPRLNGQLFTAANGYEGPGAGVGNGVFAIGLWGSWSWRNSDEATMHARTDNWENWFTANSSSTERFLFLADEPTSTQVQNWTAMMDTNPGPGANLQSLATTSLLNMSGPSPTMPGLDIAATFFQVGITSVWQAAYDAAKAAGKKFYLYNTYRPGSGSLVLEDDGVSPRQMGWAQYKKGVDRWFYWDSTYYKDFKYGGRQNDVFNTAHTFGTVTGNNAVLGETGAFYANGWGVLFYPGTDKVHTASSYEINGPIASLRMKHWRRGIQDADYLALARAVNPAATQAILNRMVPKALWENGVSDPNEPTYLRADISWSVDPNDWEQARKELADIIAP